MVTNLSIPATPQRRTSEQGFTLIELMVVMFIIAILLGFAALNYRRSILHAQEAVLKQDLHAMRLAIDSYTVDKEKAPQSLRDLVEAGYLQRMPEDPITHRNDTWMPHQSDGLNSIDQTQPGIDDVHSGAEGISSEGTTYNTW